MKDDQLSRFIELAVFDLGEMKPFADFLKKRENSTCEYTSMQIPSRLQAPFPLYKKELRV